MLEFSWVTQLSAWAGLGTLVLLEVVLGVDNLVFISILVGKLPNEKKRQAFMTGLGLALLMRMVLLAFMARLVMLTDPLFTLGGHGYSARDLILMAGGVFLLLKGTMELHDRLEGHAGRFETRGPQFTDNLIHLIGVLQRAQLNHIGFAGRRRQGRLLLRWLLLLWLSRRRRWRRGLLLRLRFRLRLGLRFRGHHRLLNVIEAVAVHRHTRWI